MRHVFVETNWLVDYAAPVHKRVPAAAGLLEKARRGELLLHLPSVCVVEAKRKIHQFQPRKTAEEFRNYVRWAHVEGELSDGDRNVVLANLSKLESRVSKDLKDLDETIASLKKESGLKVFSPSERHLEMSTELSFQLNLEPFDQTILAGILVRAEEILLESKDAELVFCEKDGDLQPWDKARGLAAIFAISTIHAAFGSMATSI
jgi:hypothetical protein